MRGFLASEDIAKDTQKEGVCECLERWAHDGVWDVDVEIAFNRSFCQYLDELGICCLNSDQPLIDEASRSGKRLYYRLDTHWTPLGNRVASQAVTDYLIDERADLLLP